MRSPFAPRPLLLFLGLLGVLLIFVQLQIIRFAFERLGLSANAAFLLLLCSLLGSAFNVPLYKVRAQSPPEDGPMLRWRGLLGLPPIRFTGYTTIAINLGGCVIPAGFSLYLLMRTPGLLPDASLATALVAGLSYAVSRPVSGLGVTMPMLAAPAAAAIISILLNAEHSAPLAYICGTLGVLIGADILRLKSIGKMGAPVASIGGAGTFDGIFLSGIVAVLLA